MKPNWILVGAAAAAVIALAYVIIAPTSTLVILPYGISEDGSEIVLAEMKARDYANIISGYTWLITRVSDDKRADTQTLADVFKSAKEIFVADNSSVIDKHRIEGDKILRGDVVKARGQGPLAYAAGFVHHAAMRGEISTEVYATIKWAPYLSAGLAAYAVENLFDSTHGGFWETPEEEAKKEIKHQGYGIVALHPLQWVVEAHPERAEIGYTKADLEAIALKQDDFLLKVWSPEMGVYAEQSGPDGANATFDSVTYDTRDLGFLLWGHGILYDILKDSRPDRAAGVKERGLRLLQTTLVENVTYKQGVGIAKVVRVVNGTAEVAKDEMNTGRLFDFIHGVYNFQAATNTEVAEPFCDMVVLGAEKMHDSYGLIRDYKFSDPSQLTTWKESPYLAAYMNAAGVCWELINDADKPLVEEAMLKDFEFLRDVVAPRYQHLSFAG